MDFVARCQPIELLISDVDGVLTDGRLGFDNQGIETKRFHIRDGLGVKLWRRAGHCCAIVTARNSHIVSVRAAELGIDLVRQGFEDKLAAVREILRNLGMAPEQACYIGDDLPDVPAMRFVGLGVAVADACAEALASADHVTAANGGAGAVRELVETVLKAQGRWNDLVARYVE